MHIDVKSDKTVNKEEMGEFIAFLKEISADLDKNKVAPGDIESMHSEDFMKKLDQIQAYVDEHEFINKE